MAIPKIITNKTVITGLANSPLKALSLFKPLSGPAGVMGKVSAPSSLKVGKMASFSANFHLSVKTNHMPVNLSSPYYVAKHVVR